MYGLMTDVPPCSCPARGVYSNCVHHGEAWKRIAERCESKDISRANIQSEEISRANAVRV